MIAAASSYSQALQKKPRLRREGAHWFCRSSWAWAAGETPAEAFANYHYNMSRWMN